MQPIRIHFEKTFSALEWLDLNNVDYKFESNWPNCDVIFYIKDPKTELLFNLRWS